MGPLLLGVILAIVNWLLPFPYIIAIILWIIAAVLIVYGLYLILTSRGSATGRRGLW